MKKPNKTFAISMVLGSLLSSSFITSSYADYNTNISMLNNQNQTLSQDIENNIDPMISSTAGLMDDIRPGESREISLGNIRSAVFKVKTYEDNYPLEDLANMQINILENDKVIVHMVFDDLRGGYSRELTDLNPNAKYTLRVTNRSKHITPLTSLDILGKE